MTIGAAEQAAVSERFIRRAERAELLLSEIAPSSEALRPVLAFAAGLNRAQADLAQALERAHRGRLFSGVLEEDVDRIDPAARPLLRFVAKSGPLAVAEAAKAQIDSGERERRGAWASYWTRDDDRDGGDARGAFLSRTVLRPYAELLRRLGIVAVRLRSEGRCPACGGRPWIAARRSGSEADGAARFLLCALCGNEWQTPRIQCPACGEQGPPKLPAFKSEVHRAVRIEACERCQSYIKSIDLSLDARPIPEIDDLLSISMDLWAAEQGFARIEPGLAGV